MGVSSNEKTLEGNSSTIIMIHLMLLIPSGTFLPSLSLTIKGVLRVTVMHFGKLFDVLRRNYFEIRIFLEYLFYSSILNHIIYRK